MQNNRLSRYRYPEMGIYQDNLSSIVISNNLSPIIVIAQKSFDLLITNIVFVMYFVIDDKLSRSTIFKPVAVQSGSVQS